MIHKSRLPFVRAIVGGIVAIVLTDLVTEYLNLADSIALWAIAGAAFFVVALLVSLQSPDRWQAGALLIAVGIILGVIVDTVLQEGIRGHSRNLWPLSTPPGRHQPERWPGTDRNPGPACSGTGGRHRPEYAIQTIWIGSTDWIAIRVGICVDATAQTYRI